MNIIEIISAGMVFGLAGSLHCVGMCGPIVMALPFSESSWFSRLTSNVIYFTGKALTYAIMGFAIGLVGLTFIPKGFQQWVSIGSGIIILVMTWAPKLIKSNVGSSINSKLAKLMSSYMKETSLSKHLILGLLNGALPCGMVYMALAASITAGGVWQSALFMFVFGLGTVPLLFLIGVSKQAFSFKRRKMLQNSIPYIATVLALLFILRGLSLGIPFLSPDLDKMNINKAAQSHSEVVCH